MALIHLKFIALVFTYMTMDRLQKSGLIYLYLLPLLVAIIGFGIGQVSYLIYIPLWLINTGILAAAVWRLIRPGQAGRKYNIRAWAAAGVLLIIPWLLFSIFAGMGPLPATMAAWLAYATEQQARYSILIGGGIIALMGFALLKAKLQEQGEQTFSMLAFAAMSLAIPLFIINMAFWGYYLTSVFRYLVTLPTGEKPAWYPPVKALFYVISVVEVALIYLSALLLAISLKRAGVLSLRACRWYIVFALTGIVLAVLPPFLPEPFGTLGYLAAIPAIPFIMPYLIGVRLLVFSRMARD
ncbi:hypothetical protein GCM10023149_29380 [Mucilaginibacter gynuensis]|uniref:Spore germination protein n=1 Tax=Mucilaginibacter gynuensis TaxID=1302236 RepID=A0ABP8GM34_9SPHI